MTNIDLQTLRSFIIRHLSTMSPSSGDTTNGLAQLIGRQPGRDSDRSHTAWVVGILQDMERAGLIQRMGSEYPIVWQVKR